VQLIDDGELGVRSAVMTLERRGSSVRFITIPMLHLGSPTFYATVGRLINESDVVVIEGVSGRKAKLITLAYRFGGRWRRGDLVLQSDALRRSDITAAIIHPDITGDGFDDAWKRLSWWSRASFWAALVAFLPWMLLIGPERLVRGRLALEDLPTRSETENPLEIDDVFMTARDALLCAELTRLVETDPGRPTTVAICWGAQHMRAVMRTLIRDQRYRVSDAAWLRVF
jgi:hypothetical protein